MAAVKATRGTLLILLQNAIQFGIGLLFFTVAAKMLTATDIGFISTFTFISVLFIAVAPLSLQVAAAKYVSEFLGQNKREKAASIVRTVRTWVFSVSACLFIVFSFILFFLLVDYPLKFDLVFLVLIYSFFSTVRLTYQAFLQGLQQFKRYSLTGIVSMVSSRGLGIILIISGYGLYGVVIGWVMGEAIGSILGVFFSRDLLPQTKSSYNYKTLLAFSLPLLFTTIVTTISDWTDRILLFGNLDTLGVYELVIRGSATLFLIWTALSTTLLPMFSESYGQSEKKDMTRLSKLSIRYMLFLIVPASVGLAAISKSAMALLFGWEYTTGSTSLAILSLFSIFSSLGILASTILQAMRNTKVFLKITIVTIIVNIVVSLILVPRFGINGAATARASMVFTNFIYVFSILRQEISIEVDRTSLVKTFTASLIMAIPLFLFDYFYSGILITSAIVSVSLEILLGIGLYVAIMFSLKAFGKQDFNLIKEISPKSFTLFLKRFERFFI